MAGFIDGFMNGVQGNLNDHSNQWNQIFGNTHQSRQRAKVGERSTNEDFQNPTAQKTDGFFGGFANSFMNGVNSHADALDRKIGMLGGADSRTQRVVDAAIHDKREGAHAKLCCYHNDRGETSFADVLEHIGNHEFGSAGRDAIESPIGQAAVEIARDAVETAVEVTRDAMQTIGDSMMRDGN